MNHTAAFPGKYIQGEQALEALPSLVRSFGSRALLLASPTVIRTILPQFPEVFQPSLFTPDPFSGECCEEELERVAGAIKEAKTDILIGMGGGKTIDTAKIAADRAGIPVVIIPTIASTDAPCSGCAVTYTKDGTFRQVFYQRLNPAVVLVDMRIIAAAPARFLVAGMGDALATWFEARSCAQTNSPNECGGLGTLTSRHLARLCYDTLLKSGLQAKHDNEQHRITPALCDITEANILLSGIGFESGGLAAAHAIHNGLTALPETHAFYHGEKVAFGVLAGLHLTSAPIREIEQVYAFCESVGLPTTLAAIGLPDATREKLMPAAIKTAETGSSIHHEPIPVTPEKIVQAMLEADITGRNRLTRSPSYSVL